MNGYTHNPTSILRQITQGVKALKNFHLSDLRKVFSLMGKNEKIGLFLLALAAIVSLFISARNFYINHTLNVAGLGGELTEGVIGQPQYINPLLAISEIDQSLTKLVFSGLYKFGPNGELVPDLAEGMPQISDDQKSYTVSLKTGAVWHNREKVTADDIVFTVDTLKNPAYKSPLRGFWQNTKVEKLSDNSVRFTNKDISGPFIYNLNLPILPKNIWAQTDPSVFLLSKANLEAIGSGPYAISQINKLPSGKIQSISLKSFRGHYNQRANIETLNLKFYDTEEALINGLRGHEISQAGAVPGAGEKLSGLEQNYTQKKLPLPQYQVVFFNLNDGLTSQPAVRLALSAATDRQSIIKNVFDSQRMWPVVPLTKTDYPEEFNIELAKQILDKDGWILGPDGVRQKKDQFLGITITTSDSQNNIRTASALQKQWQELGMRVNVDIKPNSQLMEESIKPRKFQALLYSQKFGADPDPFFFWHSSQSKDPGLNLTGLADPALDKLLTEARNTTNPDLRAQKYAEISRAISDKNAFIMLDQNQYYYFIDKRVNDIQLKYLVDSPSRFYDLPNWYLESKRVWK